MGNTFSSAKPAWLAAAAADPSLPLARDPAEFEDGAAVLFLIDVTGSMGQWIAAVNAALPSLVHSVAITDIFGKMAILEYSDYDQPVDRVCGFSGWRVTSKADDVAALAAFAKAMTPRGGGGAPEAFKTSLYQLVAEAREVSNLSRVHVLHLTDAPPHCLPTLDAEGKKENAALGEGFAWHSVVLKLLSHVPTLRYTVLSSCNHALYCDLAARTGGSAHLLQGQVSASVIREEISHIMNGWLGLPGAHSHQFVLRTPIDVNVAPPADEAELIARGVTNVTQPMDACRVVKARMNVALTRLRKDALYRVPLLNALGQILDLDPMALTVSPVVGKLWREMCKMRSDERRDELIERLSKRKADLARGDREALDKWLRESYDAKAEIEEQLREWMQRNDTRGLLRFVPEDESLCAQQVVQLLARNDKQSTTIIRAILSRMLRDESTVIPRVVDDADRGAGNTHADPTQGIDGDWKIPDSLLSARPHFRSAIVVLLPDDVAARVNELREGNDTGYPRWMPHITIAFPFLPPDVFAAAIPAISTLLQGKTAEGAVPKPFQLTLAEVGCFPGAKAVLHLRPEVFAKAPNGKGALEALHDLIMQAFPQVVRADRSSFEAHVTLGQCAGGKAAEARAEEIKRQWKPASFTVSQFHLIVHRDDEPTYVVEHSFDLPASVPSAGAVRRRAPAVASDDMDEAPPLPLQAGTIPLNMNPEQVMMLAMHTVAPGTKLSRRYAALLAMHATLCGSVLSPVAREFLLAVRGKWINWRRRESDNAPEVPENFAPSFVNLLLNPAFADVVTEEEAAFATFLHRILLALRFYHTEVTVQTIDGTSADGKFPDHTMVCESCNKERPLSIMSAEGKCGYCVENRADAVPACDPEKQLQVRCYTCGAFYARNGAVNIPGHSKCHGCHRLGKPSTAIECRVCHLKIVQHYNVEMGLPKHGVCGPCAHQCPPRKLSLKDHVAPVHQLMPAEAFTRLCATVGLGPVEGAATLELFSVGICDAVLRVRAIEPLPAATTDDIALTFRNATPVNAASILDEIQKIMAGTAQPQRAECALCLRDDVPLGPACGRRGCDQRVCRACAVAWYGKNEPGRKLYERALLCQFCARVPAPHVLRGVAPRLLGVSNRARGMHLDPQAFHGWCGRCDAIEEIGNRDCAELGGGDAADGVENFLCRACTTARGGHVVAATAGAKECPGCTVMVEKVDGCDHITCTNCSQHWCWQCRAAFGTADETYDHMYTVHVGDDDDDDEADE